MSHTIKLIHYLTPELKEEVKQKFKRWVRTHQGHRDILGLDVWHSFDMSNGGYVDIHFIFDEKLSLYLYPCDELHHEEVSDNVTEVWLTTSRTQNIPIEDEELEALLPQSIIEYVKETREQEIC